MNIIETNIEGVIIIEPRLFEDERGYFLESINQKEFQEKGGYLPAIRRADGAVSGSEPDGCVVLLC